MASSLKRKCNTLRMTDALAGQMRSTAARIDDEQGSDAAVTSRQETHISNLPSVVLQAIIGFLPGEGEGGICAVKSVCKDWKAAVDDAADGLWEHVFKRQFGPTLAQWSLFDQQVQPAVDGEGTHCHVWQRRFRERIIAGQNWAKGKCKQWHLPSDTDDADGAAASGSNVCAVNVQHCVLIVGLFPGGVEVWDLPSQQRVAVMKGHTGYIQSIDVDPHQEFVLTASEDRTARAWNLKTGECTAVMRHSEPVAEVWWVSSGDAGLVREPVWQNGRLELKFGGGPGKSSGTLPSVMTAMRLLDEEEDAEFLLWNLPSCKAEGSGQVNGTLVRSYSKAYMFDPSTGVLAMPGSDNHLRLHHVKSNTDLCQVRLDLEGNVKDVFFGQSSIHGWQLIVGSDCHEVAVWDLATQTRASLFRYTSVEEMTMFSLNQHLFCLTASVQRPASPNSSVRTAHFRVWDAYKGERMGALLELEVCGTPCDALEFDAQQPGKANVTVVSAGADGKVTLWTLPSGDTVELPFRMNMGEHGYLVGESSWRWFVVRDHAGLHIFDFLV